MSDKFWLRSDDWYSYAPCFGITDFTVPPHRDDDGPVANSVAVQRMCGSCGVRPECAATAHAEEWNSVWSCGTWIPGHDEDRKGAAAIRRRLLDSVPDERDARGEDV